MRIHPRGTTLALGCLFAAAPLAAQCRPSPSSNEAKLLAFFEAPLAFSALSAPSATRAGRVDIGVELSPVPSAPSRLEHATECYTSASHEHTSLTPVFVRPRLLLELPMGLGVELSYIPPITVGEAHPHLASGAITQTVALPMLGGSVPTSLMIRAHGTVGRVRGPITCAASQLQQEDAADPCYGTTPSNDRFNPTMYGVEAVLGAWSPGERFGFFAGVGSTWLRPRFEVGFTDANGVTDHTQIEVNLQRFTALAGVTARITGALFATAEVYSVPTDVTTWRVAAHYRLR